MNDLKKLLNDLNGILNKNCKENKRDLELAEFEEKILYLRNKDSFNDYRKSEAGNNTGRFNNMSKEEMVKTKKESTEVYETERSISLKDSLQEKCSNTSSSKNRVKSEISNSFGSLNESNDTILEEVIKDSLTKEADITLNDAYNNDEDQSIIQMLKGRVHERFVEQSPLSMTQPIHTAKVSETEACFKKLLAESRNFLNSKAKAPKKCFSLSEKATFRAEEFYIEKLTKGTTKENTTIEAFNYFETQNNKIKGNNKQSLVLQSDKNLLDNSIADYKESLRSQDNNMYSIQEAINKVKTDTLQSPLELPIDSLIKSQASRHNEEDLLPSSRTEDIFDEYTKKDPINQQYEKNYLLQLSLSTYLRYISLKDVLYELQSMSIKKSNRISKQDFISVIISLAGDLTREDTYNQDIETLYDAFIEENTHRLSIEDLAGGLAALCAGRMEDKIGIAFVYTGSKNGKVNYAMVFKFLLSLYKVFLSQPVSSLRNSKIEAEELSRMTVMQCFDEHERDYSQVLTINEFISWFMSEVKTLVPAYECFETSKIDLSPGSNMDSSGFQAESVYSKEEALYSPSIDEELTPCTDPQESQRQWRTFLDNYYQMYGFYPPPPPFPPQHKTITFIPETVRDYENSNKQSMSHTSSIKRKYLSKALFNCSRGYI